MNATVNIFNQDVNFQFPKKKLFKKFINEIFFKEKKKLKELKIIFCNDDFLFELNKSFLKHRTLTDIITFNLSETSEGIISEIYISIDRIKENAKKFTTSFLTELYRVIFHGVLHLCGYNDYLEEEILVIRGKEDYYLSQFLS